MSDLGLGSIGSRLEEHVADASTAAAQAEGVDIVMEKDYIDPAVGDGVDIVMEPDYLPRVWGEASTDGEASAKGEVQERLAQARLGAGAGTEAARFEPRAGCRRSNDGDVDYRHRPKLAPGQIEVTQRAFIPDQMFHGFGGDGRGLDACLSGRSRMHQYSVVDFTNGTLVANDDYSDLTQFGKVSAEANPDSTAVVRVLRGNVLFLQQDARASDPLVPGAPDIDMHGRYAMKRDEDGVVHVWMAMKTELFPSHEVLLRDPSNQTVMMWGENAAGDAPDLLGDGSWLGQASAEIRTDADGNFTAVRHPRGEWMTVAQWNQHVIALAEARR